MTSFLHLGTSGVGVWVYVVSSSPGMLFIYYYFLFIYLLLLWLYESPPVRADFQSGADFQSQRFLLEAFPRAGGLQFETWSTLIFFFSIFVRT